ncbi:MAG: ABC transporter permease subunit [Chthonomonadetes bacterium]|nr:ABC transporter permease subunit [Chthonomonadetes bacterium]
MLERLENPVFRQASRQRMRGARTYGCLLAYLLTLALVVITAYDQFTAHSAQRTTTGLAQTLFETLTLTQWFLVALVTPALTTSAITMEREQRTIDLLIMTPLSRFAIVWGKFTSALAFVVVMILCGMPLVAVLFLMGGIDVGAMVVRYAGMVLVSAVLASFGLMMSAVCGTSTLANLITYGLVGVLYFVGALAGTALVMSRAFGGSSGISTTVFGLTTWQFWMFTLGSVFLTVWLFLQIAANYLLLDPREGAWKTRLLTAVLYLWSVSTTVLGLQNSPSLISGQDLLAMLMMTWLAPIGVAVSTGVPMTGRRWYEWLHPRALAVGTVQSAPLYLVLLFMATLMGGLWVPASFRSSAVVWVFCAGYLWWLWSLGYAFSTLIPNRWGAGTALVGAIALGVQFVSTLSEVLDYRALYTFINLFVPFAPFAPRNLPSNVELWAALYPALGLVVTIGTALIRRRRERREVDRGDG